MSSNCFCGLLLSIDLHRLTTDLFPRSGSTTSTSLRQKNPLDGSVFLRFPPFSLCGTADISFRVWQCWWGTFLLKGSLYSIIPWSGTATYAWGRDRHSISWLQKSSNSDASNRRNESDSSNKSGKALPDRTILHTSGAPGVAKIGGVCVNIILCRRSCRGRWERSARL